MSLGARVEKGCHSCADNTLSCKGCDESGDRRITTTEHYPDFRQTVGTIKSKVRALERGPRINILICVNGVNGLCMNGGVCYFW